NGNFVITRVGVGHQTLLAANEASGVEASAEVDIGAPGIVVPVTIVLPGAGTIRGRLLTANGQTIGQTQVFLWFGGDGFLRTTPDGSGAFVFRNMPLRSDYTLRATTPDGDGQIVPTSLVTNGQIRITDVVLRGLGTVTGVVLDADGVSPRTAQVVITYTGFDDIGQVKDLTKIVASDQLVTPTVPGTTTCGAVCAGGGTACSGRFNA